MGRREIRSAMARRGGMGTELHAANMWELFARFVCEFRFSCCCFKSMPRNWLL
jgi:hypothetical protein